MFYPIKLMKINEFFSEM